jgi:FlaA1/EpsC-like NDP-sugar epimerase
MTPPVIIRSPDSAAELDQVLLLIPTLSRSRRRKIVEATREFRISVLQVPSVEEITSGHARIDALRPVR